MENCFNWQTYKQDFMHFYYGMSKPDELEQMSHQYPDEYFNYVTENTKLFLSNLLREMANLNQIYDNKIYYAIAIPDETKCESNISNSEWYFDQVFTTDICQSPCISTRLLTSFFGPSCDIIDTKKEEDSKITYEKVIGMPLEVFNKKFNQFFKSNPRLSLKR